MTHSNVGLPARASVQDTVDKTVIDYGSGIELHLCDSLCISCDISLYGIFTPRRICSKKTVCCIFCNDEQCVNYCDELKKYDADEILYRRMLNKQNLSVEGG